MFFVDAHVHIHACFDLERFFTSACRNFTAEAESIGAGKVSTGILLLAETSKEHWFDRLASHANGNPVPAAKKAENWSIHPTSDDSSLEVRSDHEQKVYLMAGRQIVTAEGLEVLALLTTGYWGDGLSIEDAIGLILERNGIPVIPWGFGKWTGRKGRILDEFLASEAKGRFFLSDNGGRVGLLGEPSSFKKALEKGFKILPGSDPLPFAFEQDRVGSFGFSCKEFISLTHPARGLARVLLNPGVEIHPYGKLENPLPFLFKQIAIQIRKRAERPVRR